ncbi:hypothetical protein L249_8690 [Ophiocordyceps polyrhachis-furcata BCC 54312]|uniref:Uncharacterized protein n=1 Tax=Ophiocordyceps polyrhachis-furcata BCC 54312 TaxID=1330021 RepID=A0A367L6G3_9HYPO|nr:hypothetical protein L249_8690 [Ophiocordyceps polyrhachis-furcata BCC 54312]
MAPVLSLLSLVARHLPRVPPRCRPLQTTTALNYPRAPPPSLKRGSVPKGKAKVGSKAGNQKKKKKKKGKGQARSEHYHKVRILTQNMFSPAPPPLRMARLRHLRHWTIHRAWQLFRRQHHERLALERHRLHAAMYNACEELRKTRGPGNRPEGSLYRVAMIKSGLWKFGFIPIEYARMQTETPAREAWNHAWKR